MEQIKGLFDIVSKFAIAGGVSIAVWGAINLGSSLSQGGGSGAENSNSIWKIIGGALIAVAGGVFTSISGMF